MPDTRKLELLQLLTKHRVTLTRPFYLGVHEVTQAQWRAIMATSPSHFEGRNRPVE